MISTPDLNCNMGASLDLLSPKMKMDYFRKLNFSKMLDSWSVMDHIRTFQKSRLINHSSARPLCIFTLYTLGALWLVSKYCCSTNCQFVNVHKLLLTTYKNIQSLWRFYATSKAIKCIWLQVFKIAAEVRLV